MCKGCSPLWDLGALQCFNIPAFAEIHLLWGRELRDWWAYSPICGTSYCLAPRGDLTDCCALDDPVSLVCATSPGASTFPAFALDEPVGDEEPLAAATAGPDTDEGPPPGLSAL
ncbi:hypothetical protein MTO96_005381 [Rhipicephalus appendiculatus]